MKPPETTCTPKRVEGGGWRSFNREIKAIVIKHRLDVVKAKIPRSATL